MSRAASGFGGNYKSTKFAELELAAKVIGMRNCEEEHMPLLIPVLIGIPVVVGGGWVIYHFVH